MVQPDHRSSPPGRPAGQTVFNLGIEDTPVPGIEPSRSLFIEKEFAEFFEALGPVEGRTRVSDERRSLLVKIHGMVFEGGLSVHEAHANLRRSRTRRSGKLKIITVTSGKGGVGKTTVSTNLALAFANRGHRVLLFDADMGMANVHVLNGLQPQFTVADVIEGRAKFKDCLTPGPGGVQVVCGGAGISSLANLAINKMETLTRGISNMDDMFDVCIIDTGAGISRQVMHFVDMADEILLVVTPNIASTLDGYGVIKAAHERKIKAPFYVLVNKAEDAAESQRVFERISNCSERFLQCELHSLGGLSADLAFRQANQQRIPFLLTYPDNENADHFRRMATVLWDKPQVRVIGLPEPGEAQVPVSEGHQNQNQNQNLATQATH